MITITLQEYQKIHPDYRGVWSTERTDLKNWSEIRDQFMGKRTLMKKGVLLIEGLSLCIME